MNTSLNYQVSQLASKKQRIGRLTNDFFNQVREYHVYKENENDFQVKNTFYAEANSMKRLRWFLALFIVVPVLILIDYASVYLFIEALAERLPTGFGKSVIITVSIFLFFILELATILAILRIEEILETKNSGGLRFLKYVLMITMIISPALLIYAGYSMQPTHIPGEGLKTLVLMMVSVVIHIFLFILMEDLLHAIIYIKYLVNKAIWKMKSPEPRLISLKESLRREYNSYDLEKVKISTNPHVATYLPTIELNKRERFLKEKLEDSIEDNDYDEFTDTKRFTPKSPVPPCGYSTGTNSSSTSFSSTVW